MNARRLVLATLAFAAVLALGRAHAYTTLTSPPVRLPASSMPVSFFVPSGGSADLGFDMSLAAAQAAFTTWQSASCTSLRFGYSGVTSATTGAQDGLSQVGWHESSWPP